ncbi:kinase-like domain-containing protein [Choanephora cucurbitarum]|nr:kinase-like domain-containing protein [Choanephora cucurbitarum]
MALSLNWDQLSDSMVDKRIQSYQLLEELGRGTYGCLFLGQSLVDNHYVAIKVLSKRGLDPTQLQLQQLELDIQHQLNHPYLLGLEDVEYEEDFIYMIMELCDGGDLFEYVIQNPEREDATIKAFFVQILEAIEYLHGHGIYHRDIKLENILLSSQDTCKVADFGLATRDRFSFEFGCGSTTYLGPEHFATDEQEDCFDAYDAAASDIWSLGILLLALLFGKNPWNEATEEDMGFAEFKRNPAYLAHSLFPRLSHECTRFLLDHVLCVNPSDRCDIQTMKKAFMNLSQLTVMPVDIIPHHSTKASYDSAYFSQDTVGLSWSDMVEQDLEEEEDDYDEEDDDFEHLTEDEELFIHTQEKESWWL